jgi:hypothetical protein
MANSGNDGLVPRSGRTHSRLIRSGDPKAAAVLRRHVEGHLLDRERLQPAPKPFKLSGVDAEQPAMPDGRLVYAGRAGTGIVEGLFAFRKCLTA